MCVNERSGLGWSCLYRISGSGLTLRFGGTARESCRVGVPARSHFESIRARIAVSGRRKARRELNDLFGIADSLSILLKHKPLSNDRHSSTAFSKSNEAKFPVLDKGRQMLRLLASVGSRVARSTLTQQLRFPPVNDIFVSVQVKRWINHLTLYPFQKTLASHEDCGPEPV